jgi:hypothetical protein
MGANEIVHTSIHGRGMTDLGRAHAYTIVDTATDFRVSFWKTGWLESNLPQVGADGSHL